jgi:hypothetical protein
MSKTINGMEDNIRNLNKVTEENCKNIDVIIGLIPET